MLHNHTSLMPPPLNLHQTTMDSTITPLSTIAFPRLTSPHFTSTIIASMPKCHLSPCITAFSINPHPFMPRTTAARHCSLHSQPQHALPPQSLLSFLRLTTTHQPTWLYHEAVKCRWSIPAATNNRQEILWTITAMSRCRCSTSATSAQMVGRCCLQSRSLPRTRCGPLFDVAPHIVLRHRRH